MVKVRRQNTNWKPVKETKKNWHVRALWHQWCHLAIMQGHASCSICSWSAGIISYATCRRKCITPGRILDALHHDAIPAASSSPKIFGHFRPSLWPCYCSKFDLGPSPSNSAKKAYKIQEFDFGVQFSFKPTLQLAKTLQLYLGAAEATSHRI